MADLLPHEQNRLRSHHPPVDYILLVCILIVFAFVAIGLTTGILDDIARVFAAHLVDGLP